KIPLLDQPITVDSGRETHVEKISVTTEAPFSRFRADAGDPSGVGNDLTKAHVYIRGNAVQPDIAGNESYPAWHADIEIPMIVIRDRGRRHRLRLQFHRPGGKDRSCRCK